MTILTLYPNPYSYQALKVLTQLPKPLHNLFSYTLVYLNVANESGANLTMRMRISLLSPGNCTKTL